MFVFILHVDFFFLLKSHASEGKPDLEPVISKLNQSKRRNGSKSGFPSEAWLFRRKKKSTCKIKTNTLPQILKLQPA